MSSLLAALVLAAWADVPLPAGVSLNPDTTFELNYAELPVTDGKPLKVRGHLLKSYASGPQSGDALWAKWKPLLVGKGWKLTSDEGGHSLSRGSQRLLITTPDSDASLVALVDVGGAPQKLTVKPPAAKPELVKDDQDFPFAPKFPGATLTGSAHTDVPFIVAPSTPEARFIADATELKTASAPRSLSRLEAVLSAADALKTAGWELAFVNEEDGYVQAHYGKSGRDVWMQVGHREDGTQQALSVAVVDLGADDLGKRLDRDCKVTLRGVNFDFNKATLRPDSEPMLASVAKALSARASLKLEVQGHTDAVGDDASNQKLSEARAASVVTWLVAHGIAAGRLTSRGYGETAPLADNESDVGRAKNRRVELGCAK